MADYDDIKRYIRRAFREHNHKERLENRADNYSNLNPRITGEQIRNYNQSNDNNGNDNNGNDPGIVSSLINKISNGGSSANAANDFSSELHNISSIVTLENSNNNRNRLAINPANHINLKNRIDRTSEALDHSNNTLSQFNQNLRSITSTVSQIEHVLVNAPSHRYKNLTDGNIRQLYNYAHTQTQLLNRGVDAGVLNRSKRGQLPHFSTQRANKIRGDVHRANAQYRIGRPVYGRNSERINNTTHLPTLDNPNDSNNLLKYQREMSRVGMPLTPNELFAARDLYNDRRRKGESPFRGFTTMNEASTAGNNFRNLSRNLPYLTGRVRHTRHMAERLNHYGGSRNSLRVLRQRGEELSNRQHTGFADQILDRYNSRKEDSHLSRRIARHALGNLENNHVISDNDLRNGTVWGNAKDLNSPRGRLNAIAHDNSNKNQENASNYLHYDHEADSLDKSTHKLDDFSNEVGNATAAIKSIFGGTDSNGNYHNRNLTTDPARGREPNHTYVRLNPYTPRGMMQHFLNGHEGLYAVTAMFGDAIHRIYQADQQGNSVRMQEAPNIDTQMIGRAINGGTPQYHLDNHIQDWLGARGQQLGYTSPQMSQFLANLGPTRATSYNTMRAANTEAQFSRLNGVGPEATGQLFNTLANAGGLGTGNQVDRNSLDVSRQFAGMLHNNHLGGDATQQAQGLNSIFGNMLNSGQTISPNTAGNVMAMQSVLSHGHNGQLFQGQQGAQQLNSFSNGVSGAFNNNLIRNAFASGMPQYGGQQGLYRLQLDMAEPLKHPTQLNNMISGLTNIMGPEGAEDALHQMGLGPDAARHVYSEAMHGDLTKGHLKSIERKNGKTGRNSQSNVRKQLRDSGNQTVYQLKAIRLLLEQHTSEAGDSARQVEDALGKGSDSGHLAGLKSMVYTGFANPLSTGIATTGISHLIGRIGNLGGGVSWSHPVRSMRNIGRGARFIPSKLFRIGNLSRYRKAFRLGGRSGLIRAIHRVHPHLFRRAAYSSHPSTHLFSHLSNHLGGATKGASHATTRMARLHPLTNATRGLTRSVAHTGGRILPRLVRGAGRLAGPAADAYIGYSDLKGMHYGNRARKIGGATGDLAGGAIGGTLGTAIGGIPGMMIGSAAGGWLGKHVGSGIGRLFERGNSHTAHAATISHSSRSRNTKHTTYYWLARINHLLPALAKKMEGFSDVDPSLSGSNSQGSSGTSGSNSKQAGTNNDVTNGTGAKTINQTGGQSTDNAFAYHAQITPAYTRAAYGNVSNNDDHSHHQDSHNTYNNYVTAPSQDFLSELARNAENAAQYYGQSRRTDWA